MGESSIRDPAEVQEWIAKAEEDFAGAVHLNRRKKHPLPNLVCFHAQQCAEKYLKTYLISRGTPPPRIHDLVALLDLCAACDPSFEQLRESCLRLDPYSVLFRYPGQDALLEEIPAVLNAMRKARLFVRQHLPLHSPA